MPFRKAFKGENMKLEQYYNYLIDTNIVSEDALQLVIYLDGYKESVLDDVLFCKTGYRDIKSYLYYEDNDTFKKYYTEDDIKKFI